MGARAKPKAWGDRLPLDDIRGLRLLGAAIYHAQRLEYERAYAAATDPKAIQYEMIDSADPGPARARIASRVDRAEIEARRWQRYLSALGTSDEEIVAGETATLQDFIFDPADLWRHMRLALFVVEGRADHCRDFDRETPICRNANFGRASEAGPLGILTDLFHQYWTWHMAPAHARPIFNLEFGHQIEHVHWRNYLAPYCEAPAGRGHPEGPRWHDGRHAAATHAWSLLYDAAKAGRTLLQSAAIRQSVECFTLLRPTDPDPPPREAEGYIRATSLDQAHKAVRKILERLIDREPPWGPFGD